MSHLPLDARAILQHLNELGYRNISAEQLREFLKDLRKLIKYEERLATNSKEDYFSSLHKRDTISSRAKIGEIEKENVPLIINDKRKQGRSDEVKGDLTSGKQRCTSGASNDNLNLTSLLRDKLLIEASTEPANLRQCVRRSRSKTRNPLKEIDTGATSREMCPSRSKLRKSRLRSNSSTAGSSAQVFTQAKQKPKLPRSDPVALYHYYQNEWTHFRDQIPGENSHSDLRWEIRQKLDLK